MQASRSRVVRTMWSTRSIIRAPGRGSLLVEARARALESVLQALERRVRAAHHLGPGVAGGGLHLAQLRERLVATLLELLELPGVLSLRSRLRLLRLRFPAAAFGIPLVELAL